MPQKDKNSEATVRARADAQAGYAHASAAAPAPAPVLAPAIKTRMESVIGMVLLAGVLLSATVVVFGGAIYVWRHGSETVHYRVFRGEPSDLRNLPGIMEDIPKLSGRGIIQFGLMLLVGVQIVRVLLTGVLFALERNGIFAGITGIVLLLLMYGLLIEGR